MTEPRLPGALNGVTVSGAFSEFVDATVIVTGVETCTDEVVIAKEVVVRPPAITNVAGTETAGLLDVT